MAVPLFLNQMRIHLAEQGHKMLPAVEALASLQSVGSLADWPEFSASWNTLERDEYMADGGRYRRRRHAVFSAEAEGQIMRRPHQAHYQSTHYNALNGGVMRWFAPIGDSIAQSKSMQTILQWCRDIFSSCLPSAKAWHIEVHQFRIEALADQRGFPTPEGMHRDGVDFVLVLLICRENIASGVTTIENMQGQSLGSFTLTETFDAMLIDDTRVLHGVTPVELLCAQQVAYRDVLVVTFQAQK